jgi:ribosomal protein S19E (S16A)
LAEVVVYHVLAPISRHVYCGQGISRSGSRRLSKTTGSRVKNLAEKIAAIRGRRTRCKAMLDQLERTGEDQISLTDPDSRAMAAHTRVAVGYNAQVAVDVKHKLIVEQRSPTRSSTWAN